MSEINCFNQNGSHQRFSVSLHEIHVPEVINCVIGGKLLETFLVVQAISDANHPSFIGNMNLLEAGALNTRTISVDSSVTLANPHRKILS